MPQIFSFYLADKKSERQKLFDDDAEIIPRPRTREEIIAKYRKTGVINVVGSLSYYPRSQLVVMLGHSNQLLIDLSFSRMPRLQLHKQKTSFWNAKKSLRLHILKECFFLFVCFS